MTSEKRLARIAGSLYLVIALLAIGCLGYLIDTFAHFLAPGLAETVQWVVVAPAAVGELSFVTYLLVKGVRVPERSALMPAAA